MSIAYVECGAGDVGVDVALEAEPRSRERQHATELAGAENSNR